MKPKLCICVCVCMCDNSMGIMDDRYGFVMKYNKIFKLNHDIKVLLPCQAFLWNRNKSGTQSYSEIKILL